MGKKLLVSLAMEGKFATDGLQAIDEGDDILMAMARELVTEKGIGENADAVWKRLVETRAEVFGVRGVETSAMESEPPQGNVPEAITRRRRGGVTHHTDRRVPPRRQISWGCSSSKVEAVPGRQQFLAGHSAPSLGRNGGSALRSR